MKLVDELRRAGVENIDDAVNQCADDMASNVNNEGLEAQIAWLKTCGWSEEDIRRFYQTEAK
jgi:hypothetical protein